MLTGLPVLDRLALFCGSSRFRQLPLHKASAQFRYKEAAWHVSDILVESENLVRVEGWLEIGKGGELNGRLQVGLRSDGPCGAPCRAFPTCFPLPAREPEAIWYGPM